MQDLFHALCAISDPKEMEIALKIILSPKELKEVYNRLLILDMLEKKFSHREVASQLGVGIATVTRGAQTIQSGQFSILKRYLRDT